MLRATEDPRFEQFEKNAQIMHNNVNNFYLKALKPHRYAYSVFSKTPISRGTLNTLQQNMLAKYNAFCRSLHKMNQLGLGFQANKAREIIKDRI